MIPCDFYHGTTESRAAQILEHGFLDGERRFNRWLASNGVYLVANRPSIAFYFADRAIGCDRPIGRNREAPVILSVWVNWPDRDKVLDLTSDHGLSALYDACEQLKGHFRVSKPRSIEPEECSEFAAFKADVYARQEALANLLAEAKSADERGHRKVNWTTVAIDILVILRGFTVVVAAVYEGRTFHKLFGTKMPKVPTVPEYKGIRVRDHIEVCIVDLSLIDISRTSIHEFDRARLWDDPFLKYVIG